MFKTTNIIVWDAILFVTIHMIVNRCSSYRTFDFINYWKKIRGLLRFKLETTSHIVSDK